MANENYYNDKASPASIAHALHGIDFPKEKEEIISYAKQHEGQDNPDVIDVLERLPDRRYDSMADIEKGVGKVE